MAHDIDDAFVKQYEAEVHEAYQRRGSKLRNTVRTKSGITGESTTFQTVGTGTAGKKTRHGKVPTMNVSHDPVECVLEDWYAGDWNDKLDELKYIHDERQVLVNAGVFALGRRTDDIIITDGLVAGTNQIGAGSAGMTRNKALTAIEKMGSRDVPMDDGGTTAVVGWRQWAELMAIDEFSNADYVPANELPYAGKGLFAKRWMSPMWMPHSGLPKAGNNRSTFLYHMSAVGHAIGADITADITWHGDYASHFINHMMSMGACLIDDNGIEEILCDESVALPT